MKIKLLLLFFTQPFLNSASLNNYAGGGEEEYEKVLEEIMRQSELQFQIDEEKRVQKRQQIHPDSNLIRDYTETFEVRNWTCQECDQKNACYNEICLGGDSFVGHCRQQRPTHIEPTQYEICKKADLIIQRRGGSIRQPNQGIMHLVSLLQTTEFSKFSEEILLKFGFSEDEIQCFKTYASNAAFQQKFLDERNEKALEEERIQKAKLIKEEEARKRRDERRLQEIEREKKLQQELEERIAGPSIMNLKLKQLPLEVSSMSKRYNYNKKKDEVSFYTFELQNETVEVLKKRVKQSNGNFVVKYHDSDYRKDVTDVDHLKVTFENWKVENVRRISEYNGMPIDSCCRDINKNEWQNLKLPKNEQMLQLE